MNIHTPRPFDPVGGRETPASVALNRRKWLRRAAGLATVGTAAGVAWWWFRGSDHEVIARGRATSPRSAFFEQFPGQRDERFEYGRPETVPSEAARHTNFYEFSSFKSNWRFVDSFQPYPWTLSVGGLVERPGRWDLDELMKLVARDVAERQYRHRCVERWAMAIPWTGFPLATLLKHVRPLAKATHVRFVSLYRPEEFPQ